jgi:AAA domain, putative AbiEii toxin, Type IV TA system
MIRELKIRNFKRFAEQSFFFEGHVVLAGPNNLGKTTVLQAIAAWNLAFNRWKQENHFHRPHGVYPRAPMTREQFHAVPVGSFKWLWNDRKSDGLIEIEIQSPHGWRVTMIFEWDTSEQLYVRPKPDAEPNLLRDLEFSATYIPPMAGIPVLEEPVYQPKKIEQLLGRGQTRDLIRNLLIKAHESDAWNSLQASINRLFSFELLPPDSAGANIISQYRIGGGNAAFDISSAGSGFQQVLMLLTFLHTQAGSVLLLDEPDAHLHVCLQDSIYGELRSVAARQNSQLVIATHSEVIINSVAPRELCLVYSKPRRLVDEVERDRLARSMSLLTQTDVMLALDAAGILYLEGHTDLDNLREWARILEHPIYPWLSTRPLWHPIDGSDVNRAREHYDSLMLVTDDLPGLILLDGDAHPRIPPTEINGTGLQRIKWRRYETENYLVHPATLERFIELRLGGAEAAKQAKEDARAEFEKLFGSAEVAKGFAADPLKPAPLVERFLETTKAGEAIIPAILQAAGIHGFEYTHYHEIAAVMLPEEIHPEVKEKLDAIQKAFRL